MSSTTHFEVIRKWSGVSFKCFQCHTTHIPVCGKLLFNPHLLLYKWKQIFNLLFFFLFSQKIHFVAVFSFFVVFNLFALKNHPTCFFNLFALKSDLKSDPIFFFNLFALKSDLIFFSIFLHWKWPKKWPYFCSIFLH